MTSLYEVINTFWSFWFGETPVIGSDILVLLNTVSCIALVYGIIILPILRIFRGRKK